MTLPAKRVLVLNGANLNMLGTREPHIYGSATLDDISATCASVGRECGLDVEFYQSNHEGNLIEKIQGAIDNSDAIVINAGAFTHTSIAIHDALRMFRGYKVELHISNPHLREKFRHVSYVAPAVDAVVAGLGTAGYALVVELLSTILSADRP